MHCIARAEEEEAYTAAAAVHPSEQRAVQSKRTRGSSQNTPAQRLRPARETARYGFCVVCNVVWVIWCVVYGMCNVVRGVWLTVCGVHVNCITQRLFLLLAACIYQSVLFITLRIMNVDDSAINRASHHIN